MKPPRKVLFISADQWRGREAEANIGVADPNGHDACRLVSNIEPRAVPKPKRCRIFAIHSPSKFWLVMTTTPRLRK